MLKIKQLNDLEKMNALNKYMLKSFEDTSDIVFDFEVDFDKLYKQLNVKKLMSGDKKYLLRFNKMVIDMYRKIYLPEIFTNGIKQRNLFFRLLTEPA